MSMKASMKVMLSMKVMPHYPEHEIMLSYAEHDYSISFMRSMNVHAAPKSTRLRLPQAPGGPSVMPTVLPAAGGYAARGGRRAPTSRLWRGGGSAAAG